MRTIAAVLLAGVLGFALAVSAAATIASANAPDRPVEERLRQLQSGQDTEHDDVQYGQR